jgi:hypothetical protein
VLLVPLEQLVLLVQEQPLVEQHLQHGLISVAWLALLVQLALLEQEQPLAALLQQHGLINAA